jgi:hypothetical protein
MFPISEVSVMLAISTMAGCTATLQTRNVTLQEVGSSSRGSRETGGIHIHSTPIRTSDDAHLHLALCAHQELMVYSSQSGIRPRAGGLMVVPQAGAELVVDDDPGSRVLYVIVSRTTISVADPKLAEALAAKNPGSTPTDCGTSLDGKLAKSPSNTSAARHRTPGSTGHASKHHRRPRNPTAHTPGAGSGSPVTNRDLVGTDAPPPPGNEPRRPGFEME